MLASATTSDHAVGPSSGQGCDGPSTRDEAAAATSLFTYRGTEQVTPDGNFDGGVFVRVYYVSATGRLVVTFSTPLKQSEGGCATSAHAYKEYTVEMEATGSKGTISCDPSFDIGSLLVGNNYYFVSIDHDGNTEGWNIARYDATNWSQQLAVFHAVDTPKETVTDPMVTFADGRLNVSSQYNASGNYPAGDVGAATHHHFFTPDVEFLEKRILADTPHICGSSMIYLDGVYYFVTADAFFGDVVVMQYDASWNYLGVKTLAENGHFSEGLAFDGHRFYVAYLDTSQRTPPSGLPVNLNVRLAAFDRDWNPIEDIPVTAFAWADLRQVGRPSLLLHGNRLYVSYDCDTIDPVTHQEQAKAQAFVATYEVGGLARRPVRRLLRHLTTPYRQRSSPPWPS